MKSLIILPFIMVIVLGFAMELSSIAEDASAKTLKFADDMNRAIPCAAKGIPVEVCSPDLVATDFSPELERYLETLEKINKTTEPVREALMEQLEKGVVIEDMGFSCRFDADSQKMICRSLEG